LDPLPDYFVDLLLPELFLLALLFELLVELFLFEFEVLLELFLFEFELLLFVLFLLEVEAALLPVVPEAVELVFPVE